MLLSATPPPTEVLAPSPWNLWKKTLFRFFALYFTFYVSATLFLSWWRPIVAFLADHVLKFENPVEYQPTGSGDTLFHYMQLLGVFLLASLGTILWSILDRRPRNYDALLYWLLVLVRYALGTAMIGYGFAKIYKTQFPFPFPHSLFQPLVESTPMGLVWKFMGYSTGYNYFTGFAEALGGVLLFSRRTSTFGALLSFGVMANIVALNFFFDVPVKLYSSHLLLMAAFVAAPDLQRLFTFFFLNKPVPAATPVPTLPKKWMRPTRFWLKLAFLCFFGYMTLVQGYQRSQWYKKSMSQYALYGAYQVDTFVLNGDTLPPLATDTTRWKLMLVNSDGFISAKLMNDSTQRLYVHTDTVQKFISWTSSTGAAQSSRLRYHQPDSTHLTLTGRLSQDSVQMRLRKIDLQKLPLLSRGFHWVNEYPYNR
ncbi:hypothetical protein ACFSC6_01250 [Rufibacter sediminis]|uniref:hypothetical protein n=1 Tax=Rufibacter sediminis TaxID=2762756 RepID=UPI001F5156EE|nr:hypothetical protein [Rufibacter sediminis]